MEIKGNEQKFVFSKKIEFTSDDGSTEFVELREFNMEEMKQFQRAANVQVESDKVEVKDWNAGMEKAEQFFSQCMIDSSFTYDGEKASGKQVYEILKKNSSLFQDILNNWLSPSGEDSPFHLLPKKDTK